MILGWLISRYVIPRLEADEPAILRIWREDYGE